MRRLLTAVALAAVLVTAGCTGLLNASSVGAPSSSPNDATTPDADPAATTPPEPVRDASAGRAIRVGATGRVETQPDQAVIRVAVRVTGGSAAEVRERLADNASRMRAALDGIGVDGGQITTAYYDIGRNYRADRDKDAPAFQGRHAFEITLTDLDRTGEVIVAAVENGATDVDNVRFTLSEEKRRELHREALSDAMESARAQADVIAESAGLSVAGVGSVQTADVGHSPVRFEARALMAGDAGGGTSIEGGTITVTAQVEVSYNATG